jgi:cellulose biosynthesis protein BcsE
LQDEQVLLRQGGLYWVSVDLNSDAETLARQFLSALPRAQPTTLVCGGCDPQTLLENLDGESGPERLRLFEVADSDLGMALKSWVSELHRSVRTPGSQILLLLPALAWRRFDARHLQQWCEEVRQWLRQRRCTLVVLCHGQEPALHEELVGLNEELSGLAQLYRRDGSIRYQQHFWHNELGVCTAQDFELEQVDGVFGLSQAQRGNPQAIRADDQRVYLTQRRVLEGAPPLSQQWRLFEERDELLLHALKTRAASVIVAIEGNDQVEDLARQLHKLRNHCGTALKIIVREMEPCLRYRDERLLLACGANLIVPLKASLAHFLSLTDSVQGQLWHYRSEIDFQTLYDRMHPPHVRGLLTPSTFIATLDQVYNGASGEISHQLLKLQSRGGLEIEQYLSQISLRRYGDIACVLDGTFYLFLFACRADGLEPALGNICRLPWADIFSACESLSSVDHLPRKAFIEATELPETFRLADEQVIDNLSQSVGLTGFAPHRITLSLTEPCA